MIVPYTVTKPWWCTEVFARLATCAASAADEIRGMNPILCVLVLAAAAMADETLRESDLSPAAERVLRAKLRSIHIPRIDFVDSTVRDAIEFLVVKTKMLNTEAGLGMNLRLAEPELKAAPLAVPQQRPSQIPGLIDENNAKAGPIAKKTSPRITFKAKNVSMDEILDEICRQAALRWKLTPHGISITPAPPPKRHHR